jgi:ABC-type uncharacterized transport system permease subunit
MMNFIAAGVASALTQTYFKERTCHSGNVPIDGALSRVWAIIPGLPARIPLNVAFVLALIACALVCSCGEPGGDTNPRHRRKPSAARIWRHFC